MLQRIVFAYQSIMAEPATLPALGGRDADVPLAERPICFLRHSGRSQAIFTTPLDVPIE